MSLANTNIKLKRSQNNFSDLIPQTGSSKPTIQLHFGEPLFVDNLDDNWNWESATCNAYLVLGRHPNTNGTLANVKESPVIKALSKDKADNLVFHTDHSITNEAGDDIPANLLTTTELSEDDSLNKYYILCQRENDSGDKHIYKFKMSDVYDGIYINGRGITQGIAWNDYAELRECGESVIPGQVVCDTEDGILKSSNERLQCCAHVVSDTYGQLIGKKEKNSVPIAVAGRALVYMDLSINDIKLGDCVCAGKNGLASKMTRQEIINYPDRILGIVCKVPQLESLQVDSRVWINIK